MASLAHHDHLTIVDMREDVNKYKAEDVCIFSVSIYGICLGAGT